MHGSYRADRRRGGLDLFVKEKICEDSIVTAENSWQACGLGAAGVLWNGSLRAANAQAGAGPHVAINQWSVGAMRRRDEKRPAHAAG